MSSNQTTDAPERIWLVPSLVGYEPTWSADERLRNCTVHGAPVIEYTDRDVWNDAIRVAQAVEPTNRGWVGQGDSTKADIVAALEAARDAELEPEGTKP